MNADRNMGGMIVLVVEDEPLCRTTIKTILTRYGVTVTDVPDAEKAMVALSTTPFDAVVTDIRLPGMDGIMLLRHIRARNPDIPVILMTGYSSVGSAVEAIKLGAQDYLMKPLEEPDRLLNALWTTVDRYRLTQRNRSLQEQLKSSEEKFRALFNHANDMIFVHGLTAQGEVLNCSEVNDAACRQLGHSRKDLQSLCLLDLADEEHRPEMVRMMKALLTQKRITFETVQVARDGRRIPVEISANVFTFAGRNVVLSLARDISERRVMEKTIAEAGERDRRQLGRELHDVLCQDLTSVSMLASVLQKTLAEENNVKALADANMVHELSKRAVGFCKRLCSGLFPVELETEGLQTALEQLAHNQSHLFNIPCQFRFDPEVNLADKSVALHVYRIAHEAVTNAMKHGGAKHVSILLTRQQDRTVLTIEDDGRGFPADAGSPQGMGLHIMKYRARMIGGALNLSSRDGGGTTVTCSWP